MNRLVIAVSLLTFSIAGAQAADATGRPYTAAPPVAVAYDWSGFYIGANDGGAWTHGCWTANPFIIPLLGVPINWGGPEGCQTASGPVVGGQVGYRWQSGAWVFGLEAQGNWADLTGSNPSSLVIFAGTANQTKIDAIGLFTGQIGYARNNFLLYAKGGAALAHDSYTGVLTAPLGPSLPTGFISDRGSEARWGGAVGIGGEYALTQNLSLALEYDHLFMGARDVALTYDPAFVAAVNHSEHISQDVDMVTARINYRFGGPGAAGTQAADLAVRPYTKALPMAVAYDWSGFYIGGNNGGAWSHNCWDANPFTVAPTTFSGPEGCHTASGATVGGQVGYRWQRAVWMFGLEGQGNWADLTGSNPSQLALFAGTANQTHIDAIGLFTGQIGYARNNLLFYVKDGAAVTHNSYQGVVTASLGPLAAGFIPDRGSEMRWGEVVGIGGEYALTPNWSLALEYDHLFMGARDVALLHDPGVNRNEHISQDVDMVTARVNYRFGDPAAGAQTDLSHRPGTKAPPIAVADDCERLLHRRQPRRRMEPWLLGRKPTYHSPFRRPHQLGRHRGMPYRKRHHGGWAGWLSLATRSVGIRLRSARRLGQSDWLQSFAACHFRRYRQSEQNRCDRPVHRTGRLCTEQFPVYAKGGAALAHDSYEGILTAPIGPLLPPGFISDRGSEVRWGGAVGIGGEYALPENLSLAIEYDHLFMGACNVALAYDPAFIAAVNHSERISQDIDMVTARINYRFGGPVVAKY